MLRVLLVEDSPTDAGLIEAAFSELDEHANITHVDQMGKAEAFLCRSEPVDIILLDLALPDSDGLATLERATRAAPHLPIVVLTGLEDEALGIETLRQGAQDYLVKGGTRPLLLVRAIHHAVERKRLTEDRRQTEDALRRSEERLRLALRAGRMATWDWHLPTGEIVWNDDHYRFLGYEPGSVKPDYEAWAGRIHPEDREATERQLRQSMERGGDYRAEYRVVWPDGSERWMEVRGHAEGDAAGQPVRSYGVMIDITERKQAEMALRLSESRYRTLHESLRDPFVHVSMEGRIIECNELYCKLLGYSPEEISALTYQDVTPERWHEYEEAIVRDQIIARGYSDVYEKEYRRKDGTIVPVELRTVLSRNPAGEPTAMWGIVRDITERKRTEEAAAAAQRQVQSIIDNTTAIVYAFDREGRFLLANTAIAELLNSTPEQMIGKRRHEFMPKDDADWHDANDRQVFEAGTALGFEEYSQLKGRSITWLTTKFPLRDVRGTIYAVAGISTDISERKQAEEALQHAKAAAEAATVAKGQFLANMSHELRTPMNAILGMIDVALPKATDPTVQDCLQTAKGSADLLLTLLNDLLDSAKIESGKLELESAPFSLRRMLDQITRVLAVRASEKGLAFCCRLADETPDAVMGDRTRLQQILLNLAGNAIKFTERGDVEIGLHARSNDGEVCLEFAVRDTGIGIPPSGIEHLFQPFGQADASMSRRFGGTGLGLSISRSLVEMMGGHIRAESEVGKGSTFYFTVRMPLAKECPPDSPPTPAIPVLRAATLRILLVEDNPANQKLAAYILQDRGHTVEIAANGREALRLTEQNGYDVILMDVQMPGMDGLEATAAIRKRESGGGRRTPIIAMTAHAMRGDRERCLASGMDGYLSKPIDPREMVAIVERSARISLSGEPAVAPSVSVFDPALALQQCLGKPDLLAQMIQFFSDDTVQLLPKVREALGRGDLTKVGELGHKLRGTIMYLAAQQARESALRVEHIGQGGGNPAAAQEAVAMLEQECLTLKAALAEYQAEAVPAPHRSSARPASATLFQQ